MSQIEKRLVSDHDAQVVAGVGAAVVKAGVTAAALVGGGPLAAVGVSVAYELTGVVLESQRQRLADFASRFARRTFEQPEDVQGRIRDHLETDAGSRLFEKAWQQAAQEVDPDKLNFIAALLKNSLSSDVLREHQSQWLLKILGELDSVQIVILQSFAQQNKENKKFWERHASVFENKDSPEFPNFEFSRYSRYMSGWSRETPKTDEERATAEKDREDWLREYHAYEADLPHIKEQYELARERHALHSSRVHNLVERGLLGVEREKARFSGEVDKVSEALAPLGAALLKIVDAIDHSEWGRGEQVSSVQAIQQSLVDIAQNSEEESKAQMDALRGM